MIIARLRAIGNFLRRKKEVTAMMKHLVVHVAFIAVCFCALPALGATYYLSTTGSDSNSGTASQPWQTPHHNLKCGDVIQAAKGSYNGWYFWEGEWGTVTGTGHCVAELHCTTFDTCIVNTSQNGTTGAFWVDQSHWMIDGWEVQGSVANSNIVSCFVATPNTATPANIQDIIFANDIANGCQNGGFIAHNLGGSTTISYDYVNFVGDIAFNAAQTGNECDSGIGIYEPIVADYTTGTHIYIAGNFSYGNLDANPCAGTLPSDKPTDGEGIIIDTLDYSQGGGTPYVAQVGIENNIVVNNGGRGLEVTNNSAGSQNAYVFFKNNTSWGNERDPNQLYCLGNGELLVNAAKNVQAFNGIYATSTADGCTGDAIYGAAVGSGDTSDLIEYSSIYGIGGNNTFVNGGTFTFANQTGNTIGTNPSFANAVAPGAPSCSGYANTVACMAKVISNFKASGSGTSGNGYQAPTTGSYDPFFPQWLCTVGLPSGIVTMGCEPAATPAFSLAAGTYVMPQSLTLSDSTTGSTIFWCSVTSGTCTPATKYTGVIDIDPSTTETVCAFASAPAYNQSATLCEAYKAS
jgi:hypothetical protein